MRQVKEQSLLRINRRVKTPATHILTSLNPATPRPASLSSFPTPTIAVQLTYMTNVSLCSPRASSGIRPTQVELVNSLVPASIPSNHVLLKVDRFGFSANNVTYQVLGEHPHFR